MGLEVGGVFGLIVLIADLWAIIQTIGSTTTPGKKFLWVLLILLLPVVGFIIWLFVGPRSASPGHA